MKLKLALLTTLLGLGLAATDPKEQVGVQAQEAGFQDPLTSLHKFFNPKAQELTDDSTIATGQDSMPEVDPEVTESDAATSTDDEVEKEGKAAEESIFTPEEQAMFREEPNPFFDEVQKLGEEIVDPVLLEEFQRLGAIQLGDITAEDEKNCQKAVEKMIQQFSDPKTLKAIQEFAEKPVVKAAVQEIGKAVEEAAVMVEQMVMEDLILSELEQAMFLEDARYMDPQAMFNEPVVFMEFFEIPESYGASITLPKNIEELEKKFGGNLFKALELHESEFDDAKDEVVKAQQLRQPLMDQDADEVFEYLNTDNHAEIYHGYQVSKGSMKRPRRPEQPTEAEPDVTSN